MANKIRVYAENNLNSDPIVFVHPNTAALVTGTLTAGSTNGWEAILSGVTAGDYSLFTCWLGGVLYSFLLPKVTVSDPPPTPTDPTALPFAATTSAGVFVKSSGQLLRTLWSNVTKPAGALGAMSWDGKNDAGLVVDLDPSLLEYRVVYRDATLTPTWEGVVGNTADSFTSYVWAGALTLSDLAVAPSGELFAALGYNEGQAGLVSSPAGQQAPRPVFPANFTDNFQYVRTDGTYLYAATNGGDFDDYEASFVMRFRQDTKVQAPFSAGSSVSYGSVDGTVPGNQSGVASVRLSNPAVPYSDDGSAKRAAWFANRISGLAVNGSYLAVARKGQGTVQFYNVGTGAALGVLSVATPGQVAFSASGDLWVITGGSVVRYMVGANAGSFTQQNTLAGLVAPLALDTHPSQDLLLVADAGNSHQVKAYSGAGASQWTYGQAGGYLINGPDVTNDKFWFVVNDPLSYPNPTDRDKLGDPFTFVKWVPDGTFWVLDTANGRALHFAANRTYLGQISYLADRLLPAGDQRDPTRLFSGMLEFKVSLDPLQPGDPSLSSTPSWKLVKNWAAGLDMVRYRGLVNVLTHSFTGGNGGTYAQLLDGNLVSGQAKTAFVELPATGPLRLTGELIEDYGNGGQNVEQMPGGELRTMRGSYDALDQGTGLATIWGEEKPLTGYDGNRNPQRGAVTRLWTYQSDAYKGTDPFPSKSPLARTRNAKLGNGTYLVYQALENTWSPKGGYHLGIVSPSGSTPAPLLSKFYPGDQLTTASGTGTYPDIANFAYGGLAGANAYADGDDVVALYNGQNVPKRSGIFSQFRNSLPIGDFGKAMAPYTQAAVPAGTAGNCGDMYMIRPSGTTLHVYTVDESVHQGLHRWKVPTDIGTIILPVATGGGQGAYSFTPADSSVSRISTGVQEVMNVSTSAQLKTLLSANLTDKKIVMADGTYTDNFEQTGTWTNVWLTSASNNTTITGAANSVLFIFQGGATRTKVRLSHIKFNYTGTGNSYALLYWNELGIYTGLEIDHCSFSCPNGDVNALGCSQYSTFSGSGGIAKDVYIHDCDFPNVGRIAIELLNQGYDQVRLTNLRIDNNTFGNLGLQDGRHGMAISLSGLIQRVGIKNNVSNGGKYCIYELVNVLDVIAENNSGMSQDISTVDGKPSACAGWSISKDTAHPAPKNIYITGGTLDVSGRPIQIYDADTVTVDGSNQLWKGHRCVQMNLVNSKFKALNLLIQSTAKEPGLELTSGTNNTFQDSKISNAGATAAGFMPSYEIMVLRSGTSGNTVTNMTTELGLQANGQPFAPSAATGADGRVVDQGSNNTVTGTKPSLVA